MDVDARLDALCRPLRGDVTSGASALARAAADAFRTAARELPADSPEELVRTLEALAARILDAQPAMAPLLSLAAEVLRALEGAGGSKARKGSGGGEALEHAGAGEAREGAPREARESALREAAARAATAFGEGLAVRAEAVAERAASLLGGTASRLGEAAGPLGAAPDAPAARAHARPTLLTVSSSGTVLATLLRLARSARPPLVVCLESRPASEGRALAEALAAAGVEVTFAVDAAAEALVHAAAGAVPAGGAAPAATVAAADATPPATVLLGADSIGDAGVVNKIGSAALARAARAAGASVYVLADETKILPRGVPQHLDDDRPAGEVWPAAPPGVRVWNRYFEIVPLGLVTAVVTESAVLAPDELGRFRDGLDLPPALRARVAPGSASAASGLA